MPYYGIGLITLLVQLGCAAHVIRTGRNWLWIVPIALLPWVGCAAYLLIGVLPDVVRARMPARRFYDEPTSIADPGTSYGRKKRDVETIGSAQSKRVFAEECIKRGRYGEAVELYASAMEGPHTEDPALLHGLARAKLLVGDGAGAQAAFESLKSVSPADFTADARLLYARALALQGKNDEAKAEYRALLPTYPGAEARCRYALLLQETGDPAGAETLFREIVASMRGAPGYYRRRQREWVNIAKKNLRG
ncbi:MAG: PLDc N-terminal domain-containing protein [Rhizomicrobium sp.]